MLNRKRVMLAVLKKIQDKKIRKWNTFLIKSLFILNKEYNIDKKISFYSFFPYQFGPFSFISYYDLNSLEKDNYTKDHMPIKKGKKEIEKLTYEILNGIEDCFNRFNTYYSIKNYVYTKYPEYIIKSKLIKHNKKYTLASFYTIGYEGKNIDNFLDILIQKNITSVVDVRNNPYSMNFWYIGNYLKKYLKKAGIEYINIKELGIPPEYRKNLNSKKDYNKLLAKYRKNLCKKEIYLERLIKNGQKQRTAIMCFEKSPEICHRSVIAERLREKGFLVTDL